MTRKAAKVKEELTEDQKTDLLKKITDMAQDITRMDDFDAALKAVRHLERVASRKQKGISFGKSVENVIFYIANTVIYRLQELNRYNPQEFKEYVSGTKRYFDFETCTFTLAEKCGMHRNSFTGESGAYNAMKDCGFTPFKRNEDCQGSENEFGSKVILTVDLDWVFGFSFKVSHGNSVHYIFNTGINTEHSQNGEWITTPTMLPTASESDGETKNERETDSVENNSVFGQKNSAPRPAADVPTKAVLKMAQNRLSQLVSGAYSPEMLQKGRVMLNEETILTSLKGTNPDDLLTLMIENYRGLHVPGEAWTDTDERIGLGIARKLKYLAKHPTHRIYAPLMYLSLTMKKGSLAAYCTEYLMPKPDAPTATTDNAAHPEDANVLKIPKKPLNPQFDYVAWAIEQGADAKVMRRKIRRWGHEPIADCVRFAKAKILRGFMPDNGIIRYLMGIIEGLSHAEVIRRQADEQETLLAAGITWQAERRKAQPEKSPAQQWYQKTLKLAQQMKKRLTSAQITAIATKAHERNAADAQIEVWIEAEVKNPNR